MKKSIGMILAASIAANTLSYASYGTTFAAEQAAQSDETTMQQSGSIIPDASGQTDKPGKVDASTQTPSDFNTDHEQTDTQTPSDIDVQKHAFEKPMPFLVYKDKTDARSMMDQYMMHPAKLVYSDDGISAMFTLKNASWWKKVEAFDGKEKLDIHIVSEDKQKDLKTIRIPLKPDVPGISVKVHVVVPEMDYDHTYTTQLMFAEPVAATYSDTPMSTKIPGNMYRSDQSGQPEVPVKPSKPAKPAKPTKPSKPTQSQQVDGQQQTPTHVHNQDVDTTPTSGTTRSSQARSGKQSDSTRSASPKQRVSTRQDTADGTPAYGGRTLSAKQSDDSRSKTKDGRPRYGQSSTTKPSDKAKGDKRLGFDRNADKVHRAANPATHAPESKVKDMIYLSIIMVLSILLLVGTYLYNRKGQEQNK